MATAKKKAETAQEMKEKYGKVRRHTPKTVARMVLLNYTYWAYCMNEKKTPDYIDESAYRIPLQANSLGYYYFYLGIRNWLDTAMESAVLIRNSLFSMVGEYHNICVTVIAAESLKKELGDRANEKSIYPWLKLLSDSTYVPRDRDTPTRIEHIMLDQKDYLRKTINNYLRYLNVYNSLISIIAEMIDIPELTIFQVGVDSIEKNLENVNKVMEYTITKIDSNNGEQSIEAFQPMESVAPPIPEKNIDDVKKRLARLRVEGNISFNCDTLFKKLASGYWRRNK